MTAIRPYKQFLAAILLAVYAFVITPVQLWHHHSITENILTDNPDSKHDQVSKASDFNTEGSCQICSHKYSTYNDDTLSPVESSLTLVAARNGYYCLPTISTPSLPLSNKGPPALS